MEKSWNLTNKFLTLVKWHCYAAAFQNPASMYIMDFCDILTSRFFVMDFCDMVNNKGSNLTTHVMIRIFPIVLIVKMLECVMQHIHPKQI